MLVFPYLLHLVYIRWKKYTMIWKDKVMSHNCATSVQISTTLSKADPIPVKNSTSCLNLLQQILFIKVFGTKTKKKKLKIF